MRIEPTVGRVVWYYPANGDSNKPCAALVANVHDETHIAVGYLDHIGQAHSASFVPLIQEGEARPYGRDHCTWMPYQVGQAKKHAEPAAASPSVLNLPYQETAAALSSSSALRFGDVIAALELGFRARRTGWNGRNMWIAYSPGSESLPAEKFWSGANREYAERRGGYARVQPCLTMCTADGSIQMGWLASQRDMLATDWEVLHGWTDEDERPEVHL